MAKSKEQKQQEALQRKRDMFTAKSIENQSCNVGGDIYQEREKRYGKEYAEKRRNEANATFGRYLKEVGLDSHGNVIHKNPNELKVGNVESRHGKINIVFSKDEYLVSNYLDDMNRGF